MMVARMVKLNKGRFQEANSINFIHNMFSNTYFLSCVYSKVMILINKITFSVQTHFLMHGHLSSRIIFHSGKYCSTF
jgi:hypothetical protein